MLLKKKNLSSKKVFSEVTKKRRKETVHKQVFISFVYGRILDSIKIYRFALETFSVFFYIKGNLGLSPFCFKQKLKNFLKYSCKFQKYFKFTYRFCLNL